MLSSPSHPDVLVLGAGALGLASAAALAQAGAAVTVVDAGGPANASAVAAGMIAPAFEAAHEDADGERAALYRSARDLWAGFADGCGIALDRRGAAWVGAPEPLIGRMRALGFAVEPTGEGFFTPEDQLVDPAQAMAALRACAEARGGRFVGATAVAVEPVAGGARVRLADGGMLQAKAAVLAAGWAAGALAVPGLRPLLGRIAPIKGQIVELEGPGAAAVGLVTRAPGVYLIPRGGRLLAGATMEAGLSDTAPDAEAGARLHAAAAAAVPALADTRIAAMRAGVRGSLPDGLPAAGATAVPGVFAALAPRRNGWLFAPLVAKIVAAAVLGNAIGPESVALRPDRFA